MPQASLVGSLPRTLSEPSGISKCAVIMRMEKALLFTMLRQPENYAVAEENSPDMVRKKQGSGKP